MNQVQIAEKLLSDAKLQEKLDINLRQLKELEEDHKGKCFGTDSFNRYYAEAHEGAVYYEKFFLEKNEIFVIEHTITLKHMDAYHKDFKKHISYGTYIEKRQLTGLNTRSASQNLYSGYSWYRTEIPFDKFKQLWDIGEEVKDTFEKAFRGIFPDLRKEWISQGNHDNEISIEKCLLDMNIEMIDFKKYPEVHKCIEYRTLPMFDKRRWLPKQYAKQILE